MADTPIEEAAAAIAEMEAEARAKRYTAKEGDLLGEVEIEGGMKVRHRQPSSMVRKGDVELPERVRYYRSRNGWEAWLPTAQLVHHLSKRHPDGTPVFVKEKPAIAEELYEETCEVCLKNSMGRVRKKFRDEFAYVGHMEVLHPREYRVIQAREEREKSGAVTTAAIATALLEMGEQEKASLRQLLGEDKEDAGEESDGPAEGTCEWCGWKPKRGRDPARSLAAHQRLHCPNRPGGAAVGGNGSERM